MVNSLSKHARLEVKPILASSLRRRQQPLILVFGWRRSDRTDNRLLFTYRQGETMTTRA